jgi:hypothetical protein
MTIVFTKADCFGGKSWLGRVYYVAASERGEGFYQHGECERYKFSPNGSPVKWVDVTPELKSKLIQEYCDLWEVIITHDKNFYCTGCFDARDGVDTSELREKIRKGLIEAVVRSDD